MKSVFKFLLFILLAFTLALSAWGAYDLRKNKFQEMPGETYVTIQGVPIRYRQTGQGPDLLLLHGSPGMLEDWAEVQKILSKNFRVTAVDRPGHGLSGEARKGTVRGNAEFAWSLIEKLQLKDVTVVGHSFGGGVALFLSLQETSKIKNFVLVCTPPFHSKMGHWSFSLLRIPYFGRGFAKVFLPLKGDALIDKGIRISFGPKKELIPPGFIEERKARWLNPKVMTTVAREILDLNEQLIQMQWSYPSIQKPILILTGEQDRYYEDAKKLNSEISSSRLVALPETGHYLQVERPREIAEAIRDFLGISAPEVTSRDS